MRTVDHQQWVKDYTRTASNALDNVDHFAQRDLLDNMVYWMKAARAALKHASRHMRALVAAHDQRVVGRFPATGFLATALRVQMQRYAAWAAKQDLDVRRVVPGLEGLDGEWEDHEAYIDYGVAQAAVWLVKAEEWLAKRDAATDRGVWQYHDDIAKQCLEKVHEFLMLAGQALRGARGGHGGDNGWGPRYQEQVERFREVTTRVRARFRLPGLDGLWRGRR